MDTAPTTCREMLGLLDEAISGLRAAAGESSFAFELVAIGAAARYPRSRGDAGSAHRHPKPSLQAIAAAKATDIAVDRVSILRGVVAALDNPAKRGAGVVGPRRPAAGRSAPSRRKRGTTRRTPS